MSAKYFISFIYIVIKIVTPALLIVFNSHVVSKYQPFGIMVSMFANDLGDQGSIPGQVIPKTQKMVLDASLFNSMT